MKSLNLVKHAPFGPQLSKAFEQFQFETCIVVGSGNPKSATATASANRCRTPIDVASRMPLAITGAVALGLLKSLMLNHYRREA